VSAVDVSNAMPVGSAQRFDDTANGRAESEVVVAIFKKASGRQTVTLIELQEAALCHGWVDTQIMRLDDERYAIRFVPRRAGSTWGPKNRRMAKRLLREGRVRPAGLATLPENL
jgi:uncharacterized protein YdeI (YjbR/CyaY-like superfamily)